MADGVLDSRPVLINLQELVFAEPEGAPALLAPLLSKSVVACDEVGSGIIPVAAAARAGREATGRLCVLLAQRAEHVVRLVAGIPTVIK
jgi:adenosyl cobinamide kinase/adenosyl cobinamide phosphate guanylyltransferase